LEIICQKAQKKFLLLCCVTRDVRTQTSKMLSRQNDGANKKSCRKKLQAKFEAKSSSRRVHLFTLLAHSIMLLGTKNPPRQTARLLKDAPGDFTGAAELEMSFRMFPFARERFPAIEFHPSSR
jgi:hypothetical protein